MDRCAVVPAVGWSHRAAAWYTYHRALSLFSHLLSIILGIWEQDFWHQVGRQKYLLFILMDLARRILDSTY